MKTKVEKIVTVHEPFELEIIGATLLSVEETKALPDKDLVCESWWWLRSPGYSHGIAVAVGGVDSVHAFGNFVYDGSVGVRPALQIANLASSNLKIGDEFDIEGKRFKVISDHLALCDSIVGYTRFDNLSNDYERSEIKKYVDHWFDALMNRRTCA